MDAEMNNSPVSWPAITTKIDAIYLGEPWIRQPSKSGRGDGKSKSQKKWAEKKQMHQKLIDRVKDTRGKNTRVLALRYNETRTKTVDHANPKVPNNPIPMYFPLAQTAHVRIVKITERW
jgi:hypothetical protein